MIAELIKALFYEQPRMIYVEFPCRKCNRPIIMPFTIRELSSDIGLCWKCHEQYNVLFKDETLRITTMDKPDQQLNP